MPVEGHLQSVVRVARVHGIVPLVGLLSVIIVGVAPCDVEVPERHLPPWVDAGLLRARVTIFIQVGREPIAVDVHGYLCREQIVDERSFVDVVAVASLRILPVVGEERTLHLVYLLLQGTLRSGGQGGPVFLVGRLVLIVDVLPRQFVVALHVAPGMVLRDIVRLVVAVYLHEIVAREVAVASARIFEVEAILTLRDTLAEGIHAIIVAVEEELAEASVGHIVHPGTSQVERQDVAEHRLVAPRCDEGPLVVLPHAQYLHLLLVTAVVGKESFLQCPEGVRLLVGAVERRVAPVFQGYPSLVVDSLVGVGDGVAMIELAFAIVNHLHLGQDIGVAQNHLTLHVDEDDGKVRLVYLHETVAQLAAIVVGLLGCDVEA